MREAQPIRKGVALDGGAVQLAAQMTRAAGGQVNQRAVVPEHQVVGLPLMAIDVLRQHAVGIQLRQDGFAFIFRQADDAGGEAFADEQRLAPGFRVGADDGMHDFGDLGQLLRRERRAPVAFEFGLAVARRVGVRRRTALHRFAQRFRQPVPGLVHVSEQRIAAFARQLLGMKHRAEAGQFFIGKV